MLKRKLDTAFGSSIEQAQKLTTAMMSDKHAKLGVFMNIMQVIGKGCGYCMAKGITNPQVHYGHECPSLSEPMQNAFKAFRKSVQYPKTYQTTLPCFRCHVCSMGDDALHPKFVRGDHQLCPNPNLVLQLAFAIYHLPNLREPAEAYFKPQHQKQSWQSITQFKDWFILEHDKYSTNGMALLAWYANSYR
jgi:hypothetical protein